MQSLRDDPTWICGMVWKLLPDWYYWLFSSLIILILYRFVVSLIASSWYEEAWHIWDFPKWRLYPGISDPWWVCKSMSWDLTTGPAGHLWIPVVRSYWNQFEWVKQGPPAWWDGGTLVCGSGRSIILPRQWWEQYCRLSGDYWVGPSEPWERRTTVPEYYLPLPIPWWTQHFGTGGERWYKCTWSSCCFPTPYPTTYPPETLHNLHIGRGQVTGRCPPCPWPRMGLLYGRLNSELSPLPHRICGVPCIGACVPCAGTQYQMRPIFFLGKGGNCLPDLGEIFQSIYDAEST